MRKKPRRWRKDFPYYKVLAFEEDVKSWKDEPGAFGTLREAEEYIARRVAPRPARIMVVEGVRRRYPLES